MTPTHIGLDALARRVREELVRIPRQEWMRYLVWFRERLTRIEPRGDLIAAHLATPDGPEVAITRKLILASGIQGAGEPSVPPIVQVSLLRASWGTHTTERIDFPT